MCMVVQWIKPDKEPVILRELNQTKTDILWQYGA